MIWWAIRALHQAGVTEILVNVHHLAHIVQTLCRRAATQLDIPITCVWQAALDGPAGGMRACLSQVSGRVSAVVINADVFIEGDIADLVRDHVQTAADLTIAAVSCLDSSAYGRLVVAGDGQVLEIREKDAAVPGLVNCGLYVLSARGVDIVRHYERAENVDDLVPAMHSAGRSVRPWSGLQAWRDIGTPAALLETNLRLLQVATLDLVQSTGSIVVQRWCGSSERSGSARDWSLVGQGSVLEDAVDFARTIIGRDVYVRSGARLRDCVVLDGATVPAGQHVGGVLIPGVDRPAGVPNR